MIVMCSWCHYIGSGATLSQQVSDVESHEENCSERKTEEQKETAMGWDM